MLYTLCISFFVCVSARSCDKSNSTLEEGIVGEKSSLPWLGVLRVHIHDRGKFMVAVTGILLVRRNHAIANAGDVSKFSKTYLKQDSKAMFIVEDHEPWFCRVQDYTLHPEYEVGYNTIALLELAPENTSRIHPICLPRYSFNASNQLYAVGYTDQNKILEKVIYKMEYVNNVLCNEFYERAGSKYTRDTQNYICGYSPSNKQNCEWDNGVVLVSNSSGCWGLIGFGVRGPGCSGPARFIIMYPYLEWVDAMINLFN